MKLPLPKCNASVQIGEFTVKGEYRAPNLFLEDPYDLKEGDVVCICSTADLMAGGCKCKGA